MWSPFRRQTKQLSTVAAPTTMPYTSETGPPGVWIDIGGGPTVKPALDRDTRAMMVEYTRSIYLWRCIDLIASQNGVIPLYVATVEDRNLTGPEAEVARLLARPNPQWTATALLYFLAASLAVANRAYLQRVRGVGNRTLELWPVAADSVVNVVAKDTDIIVAYEITRGTQKETFRIAPNGDCDIIHMARPSLSNRADKSPAAVAAPPAEVFTRILQRCADIVSNSSTITGLLSTKSDLGENAIQKIKERLNQFRIGQSEAGSTLVAGNAEWNLTRLSDDPTSALSVEIKDSLARDVAMTFGVPTQMLGLRGNDTYNNMLTARVSFITETVLPGYTHIISDALTQALLREIPETTIQPDTDQVPAMVEARRALVDIAAKATMLSLNEQRAMIGFPPYEDEQADIPVGLEKMRSDRTRAEAGTAPGVQATLEEDEEAET